MGIAALTWPRLERWKAGKGVGRDCMSVGSRGGVGMGDGGGSGDCTEEEG